MKGVVKAICIAPNAGAPMVEANLVEAVVGQGLWGDRYAHGEGSFNKDRPGHRQISLINACFFENSDFEFKDSRRNILVEGVELMMLIGQNFRIGTALLHGVKYCDPCQRPSKLSGKQASFKEQFWDRGGLIASVREGGIIRTGDSIDTLK